MEELLQFLRELADNNSKAWFEANRPRYDKARKAFLEVVRATIREMGKHQKLPPLEPADCVFRINRDVRFSKDKSPYKKNMSFVISPQGKKGEVVEGIYVHVQPGESFVAMGLYEPDTEALKKIRQEIDFNLDKWKAILEDAAFKKTYGTVGGNTLKTSPKGYDAGNPAIEWLRHTSFIASAPLTDAQVVSAKLPEIVGRAFQAAEPLREFLKEALA